MLDLRPTCENCNRPLPPDAEDAMICSFECTFCVACVQELLLNVCPNCGGGFERRPVRPARNWKGGNDLAHYPATQTIKCRPVDRMVHDRFARPITTMPPSRR